MANNSILFEVVVTDKGLQVVEKKLDGVTEASNRAAASTEKLSRTQKNTSANYNKQQKGVAQATSNSTKAFSKQAQFIQGGLVPAYAEIASRVFAITAFFGALQRAAQTEKLAQGLEVLGTSSGVALKTLSQGLQEATGFALSMEEAMRSTNLVISAGFDSSSIERLGEVARTASIALGRDTADSLSRLTRGATKLEPELLDELGIMVRLDEATQNYASQIGKTVGELTNFERRQAFMNAVLEEGEEKFSALADVDASAYDKLAATFNDLSKTLLNIVNLAFAPFLSILAESKLLLLAVFTAFGSTVLRSIAPGLSDLGARYDSLRDSVKATAVGQIQSLTVLKNTGPALQQAMQAIEDGIPVEEALTKARNSAQGTLGVLVKRYNRITKAQGENSEEARRLRVEIEGQRKAYNDLGITINKVIAAQNNLTKEQQVSTLLSTGRFAEAWSTAGDLFKDYGTQLGEAGQDQKGFQKLLSKLGPIFGGAASAARIFGTALSLAIPIFAAITAVIGALQLVVSGVTKLFYFFNEAAADAKKQTEKLEKTSSELTETFENLNKASEGQTSVYKTLTQEVTAAANAYTTLYDSVNQTADSLAYAREEGDVVIDSGTGAVRALQESIKNSRELSEKFKEAFNTDEVNLLSMAGGTLVGSLRTLDDVTEKVLKPVRIFNSELRETSKASQTASKTVRDLYTSLRQKTPFDQTVTDITDLRKNLSNLAKREGKEAEKAFSLLQERAKSGDFDKLISPSLLNRLKEAKNVSAEQAKELISQLKTETEQQERLFKRQQTDLSIAKSTANIAKGKITVLQNEEITRESLNKIALAENKVLAAQILEKQTLLELAEKEEQELINNKATLEEINRATKIRESLEQDINALGATLTDELDRQLFIEEGMLKKLQEQVGFEKQINEQLRAGIEAKKKALELDQQLLSAANKLKNAQRGLAAKETSVQEFDRIKDNFKVTEDGEVSLNKERKDLLNEEKNIKLALIDLEMSVLEAEMRVLQAKIAASDNISQETKDRLSGELDKVITNITAEEGLRDRLRQNAIKKASLQEQNEILIYFDKRNAAEKELRDNRLAAAQLENDLAKELLDLNDRILKDKMSTIDSQRKVEEERLRVQNAATRIDGKRVLTAQQIAQLDEDTRKKKEALIKQETKNKLEAIKLEFELLRAKREVQKAEQELLIAKIGVEDPQKANELRSVLNAAYEASGKLLDMAEASARERIKALGESLIADLEKAARDSIEKAGATNFLANTDTGKFISDIEAAMDRGSVTIEQAENKKKEADTNVDTIKAKIFAKNSGMGGNETFEELNEQLATAEEAARNAGLGAKQAFLQATLEGVQPMLDKLRELGPEGELVATVTQSTMIMGMAFMELAKSGTSAADKMAAVGMIVGEIGNILAASSKAKIAGIDKEIEAEKKRDGKSKESLAKIQALEKKKERAERKAFEQNKKIKMAETIINTAAAIMKYMSTGNLAMAIASGVLGAAQLAIIAGTSYNGGGSGGGGSSVPTEISVGERSNRVDVAQQATGSELSGLRGGNTANVGGQNMIPPPAFMGAKYRAQGGPTAGYVVGEQGPELFVPEVPGRIVPNDEMKQSQPLNVNFNVQAIDASSFNDALITQRGNIISMIREAANTYGETFLEGVNDVAISSGRGKV